MKTPTNSFVFWAAVTVGCSSEPTATTSSTGAATPTTSTSAAALIASSSAAPPSSASAAAKAPARPLYYETAIGEQELAGRTLRELTLMRNTIFARAGNSFRKPWLDEHFKAEPWYQAKDKTDESKITTIDRENARKIGDYDAALSKADLERRRDEVLARFKDKTASAEDEIEIALLSQRLGVWLLAPERPAPSPLEEPAQLDRLVTVEQLSKLSRRDLRILRNMVYARRGRTFESAVVNGFFKNAAWYAPDKAYSDDRLNEIDRKNIAIVRSVEDSIGGPEHENPSYGKDGWFVMA